MKIVTLQTRDAHNAIVDSFLKRLIFEYVELYLGKFAYCVGNYPAAGSSCTYSVSVLHDVSVCRVLWCCMCTSMCMMIFTCMYVPNCLYYAKSATRIQVSEQVVHQSISCGRGLNQVYVFLPIFPVCASLQSAQR